MPNHLWLLQTLILLFDVSLAAFPLVDFDRMGKVGLAGSFAGLDFFQNSSDTIAFYPNASSLLSRSSDGSLSHIGNTDSGGIVSAGCVLGDTFFFAGSFSAVASVPSSNVASYSQSTGQFTALGSGGPNGQVDAIFCEASQNEVWVGGSFTSPSSAVAIWNTKTNSWNPPPFSGLNGHIRSITANTSQSSLIFAGSFLVMFDGNGTSIALNGSNNPNVPFSAGATPFSSSLVPIPLQSAQVDGSPSSNDAQFDNISNILCPSGPDGPGNSWFAADGNTALVTVRTFTSFNANGLRLGNTFQSNHGTTGFSVTTIPDNNVQTLTYIDPSSGQNQSCSNPCLLSTDSSLLYQDFLFPQTLDITGVQIKLSEWTGAAPGLHILQLLSSGAFASAVASQNEPSCFAPNPSNTSFTGTWIEKDANTNIPGTVQAVLVSEVQVGTPAANGPSFTWIPYVSSSGNYNINLLVPGCANFQDCDSRTTVKVTVFPGQGLQPWVTTVSQQNTDDAYTLVYSGPILPSSPDFVATISMTLADSPVGSGQGGQYEIVAGQVQMALISANISSSSNSGTGNGGESNGTIAGGKTAFGFFEWPLNSVSMVSALGALPNTTETALDAIGFALFNGIGGPTSGGEIAAVVQHPDGTVFLGGNFTLTSGSASGTSHIVAFHNGALLALSGNGLDGPVTSLVIFDSTLFVGGEFTDTATQSTAGKLNNIAAYDIQANQWLALQDGLDGRVTDLGFSSGQVLVTGSFTQIIGTAAPAVGFAAWDVASTVWVNPGGFLIGSMTFVGNSTAPSKGAQQMQIIAGNVTAAARFGASGLVMLQNGNSSGPLVTPLEIQLSNVVNANSLSTVTATKRRSHRGRGVAAPFPHNKGSLSLLSRQSTSQLSLLPFYLPSPAPAVIAGTFWTNSSSSKELTVIGGNFSFTPPSGPFEARGVALYDPSSSTLEALQGSQVNGTVHALLISGNKLFVGGDFTLEGTNANGLAIYDLLAKEWDVSGVQPLQASSGSDVIVRSITKASNDTIVVAGSFAQAGSLPCQAVCAFNTASNQWNPLGTGIQGEVASVSYGGESNALLFVSGSIALSDNTSANIARFSFSNSTWVALGTPSDLPGPVTAVAVNNGNTSSIFAAGRSNDGTSSFLLFWNGRVWTDLGGDFDGGTSISQLVMVPLQNTHTSNSIIENDRILMMSGMLQSDQFGNASAALFDGQDFIPFIVSTSLSGAPGSASSLFNSDSNFSFLQRHFLATGVVILISIAIAAGVVFFLALIGILWTLLGRKDDKKLDAVDLDDDDDDSTHHRPSSLLEHINAATRTTILGGAFGNYHNEKEEEIVDRGAGTATPEPDPFAADGSNYIRAQTPTDVLGGTMAAEEESSRPAHARYSFDGKGEGELALSTGLEVEVLDDRDPAWWYARNTRTGQEGVVPAAYLY